MTWNVQYLLLWTVTSIFTVWFLNWLWKRRWLYIRSWNVPGPLALPFVGIGYKFALNVEDAMDVILKYAGQYPSPVKSWLGSQLVYGIFEPSQIEKILTHSSCLGKDNFYDNVIDVLGEGLFTAPTATWKKHKKIIMPSFNQKILDSFVGTYTKQTSIFIEIMKKHIGRKDIDVIQFVGSLFVDIICDSIMGTEINAQGGNDALTKHFDKILEILLIRVFSIWGHFKWAWWLHPLNLENMKHAAALHNIVQTVLRSKKQLLEEKKNMKSERVLHIDEKEEPPKKKAFLDLLLENSDFTEKELQDEVEIFMLAGFDTTTKTTCYLLEMLALFPEVQQKVYEEVIEVVGQDRDVEAADLPELKYMERVIKETMRLFPIGIFFTRLVAEDIQIGKYTLPKGASTLFSSVFMHRNAKYWPNPLKFDPDRFLPEEVAKRHPCCYLAFSYGPRGCIGSKFAMMEMKSFVAATIRKFKFFTQYKSLEDVEVKTSILSLPKNGFKVYLEYR